ncbi:IclR family transcriptional regulator [Glutamicibacter halophytocola]|uniref:IclR family transcriptional regulator n=1 Tax=Glutamicibacter halophytocola TaxID=1933880 RepID=A0ABX5YBW5_9MICC|nr:IclR family transcriptional regulator [Glutamicibacter halophytocola]NQD42572.1 IclR family transcriptional regulator [Glutamicibacter halophytocola]QDY67143.1 IclR family transcriptional regulator [Glutamicibacter halophytocola]
MADTEAKSSAGVAANRSVSRAISILRAMAASPNPMNVTEIGLKVGLPRATAFRLLVTLEEEGFVDRQETLYTLGWDLARIAQDVDPSSGLASRVQGTVAEIADELGETLTLSLRRGRYDLDLIVQQSPRAIGVTMSDMHGMKWPLHAAATGKLLLADLDNEEIKVATNNKLEKLTPATISTYPALFKHIEQVREQGWASTIEELEEGIISFAVPIYGKTGHLLASLAYIAPRLRIGTASVEEEKIEALKEGAQRLARRIISLAN